MHQQKCKRGSLLPALLVFPITYMSQTGVNQCPKLILISISVEEQSGHSSLLSLADLVIVHRYYEVLRNVRLLGCVSFMCHSLQWKKRSTASTRDFFLYVSVHTGTGPSSDHYSY